MSELIHAGVAVNEEMLAYQGTNRLGGEKFSPSTKTRESLRLKKHKNKGEGAVPCNLQQFIFQMVLIEFF